MVTRVWANTRASLEVDGWRPTRERIVWLAISLSLVLIPHVLRMPLWVTVSFVLLTLWRGRKRGT